MTSALSNPYEITVAGITCKSSPFDNGYYISNEDLEKLGENNVKKFKDALFAIYEAEQSRQLNGIKVYGLKNNGNSVSSNVEKNRE